MLVIEKLPATSTENRDPSEKVLIFRGSVSWDDKLKSDYIYINFHIPESVKCLEISYTYPENSGCILDIGLLGPGEVFRGWSGSNKKQIHLSPESATPGYLRGPIDPGEWSIMLGLAKIPRNGYCPYQVIIKAQDCEGLAQHNPGIQCTAPKKRAKPPENWLKGDLHVHSVHSDGVNTICDIALDAIRQGLDYIAITDHNTISHHEELEIVGRGIGRENLILIPGVEITTYYGHLNVWGEGWIDFRRGPRELGSLVQAAHEKGLVISANHPFRDLGDLCIGCALADKSIRGFDAVEVWSGPWHAFGNREALYWWHTMLSEGLRVAAIGGSDYHGRRDSVIRVGEPTTWIKPSSGTSKGLIEAIKLGRTYVTASPKGPRIDITLARGSTETYSIGDTVAVEDRGENLKLVIEIQGDELEAILKLITAEGVIHTQIVRGGDNKFVKDIILSKEHRFLRAELGIFSDPYSVMLKNGDIMIALTSPIYLR